MKNVEMLFVFWATVEWAKLEKKLIPIWLKIVYFKKKTLECHFNKEHKIIIIQGTSEWLICISIWGTYTTNKNINATFLFLLPFPEVQYIEGFFHAHKKACFSQILSTDLFKSVLVGTFSNVFCVHKKVFKSLNSNLWKMRQKRVAFIFLISVLF